MLLVHSDHNKQHTSAARRLGHGIKATDEQTLNDAGKATDEPTSSIHNFGPHRDFTRSLLSFLLLKNLTPPPLPRVTLYPLYCHISGEVVYRSGTWRGRER